jgi:probable rRNA maturation factor
LRLALQRDDTIDALPADRRQLRRWIAAALEIDADLTIRFVGIDEGRQLNRAFRGHDHPTNVLTFPYGSDVGAVPRARGAASGAARAAQRGRIHADIVLCMPIVTSEAAEQLKPLRDHLAHLLVHGVLHAQGYDHVKAVDAARMQARETAVLARLRIDDPYADR